MIENAKQTQRARQVREQGLAHATAHQMSGLARQAYADKAGISVYKLDYWRTLARRVHTADATPPITTATSLPSPSPSPSTHTGLTPPLFMEINRAADTEPTALDLDLDLDLDPTAHHNATSNSNAHSASLACPTQVAASIELHLGGAWQGHRLCLPTTIDDAWLASLLNALPTHTSPHTPPHTPPHTLPHRRPLSLPLPPPPSSSSQSECIVKSNRANSGAIS